VLQLDTPVMIHVHDVIGNWVSTRTA